LLHSCLVFVQFLLCDGPIVCPEMDKELQAGYLSKSGDGVF
jgi:hypothetical protein